MTNENCESHSHSKESLALQSILGGTKLSPQAFFDTVWQEKCTVFPCQDSRGTSIPTKNQTSANAVGVGVGWWNEEQVRQQPFEELIRHGPQILTDILERARNRTEVGAIRTVENEAHAPTTQQHAPLLFQNQTPIPDPHTLYGTSLFSAYLDGCSIVLNHADAISAPIAVLCQDLQHSFPHAYANVYITPPNLQAVSPHADDRDVLVIQIVGKKRWTVYGGVPIHYPYSHEQVGKHGLEVPEWVLEGPRLVDCVLEAGDVLYMPRGFVHEARAVSDEMSFHVTVALATQDWTLGGLISAELVQQNSANHGSSARSSHNLAKSLRKAVPRCFGRDDIHRIPTVEKEALTNEINDILKTLKEQLTIQRISSSLQCKYESHNNRAFQIRSQVTINDPADILIVAMQIRESNNRAFQIRSQVIHSMNDQQQTQTHQQTQTQTQHKNHQVVGRDAAQTVGMDTIVRAATAPEKERVTLFESQRSDQSITPLPKRGLQVREDIADAIIRILTKLKSESKPQTTCRVGDLKSLLSNVEQHELRSSLDLVCDLTLLSFARQCVELGALAIDG
eukprot:CAMPEP_0194395094 /NCGR_PEP_ID=MMETSP0174-20130528/124227_1 /TAXON_ID=216777 /ORGANISM="Proboscia alata, Strain PI-D3" /LENGTH=564 /DNA_ID=CAMNT_0039190981 /DNA_START=69 /DNA_END=1764 /DNA_ORIENTATION=-